MIKDGYELNQSEPFLWYASDNFFLRAGAKCFYADVRVSSRGWLKKQPLYNIGSTNSDVDFFTYHMV